MPTQARYLSPEIFFFALMTAAFLVVFLCPAYVLLQPSDTAFPVVNAYEHYLPYLSRISSINAGAAQLEYGSEMARSLYAVRGHVQVFSIVLMLPLSIISVLFAAYYKVNTHFPTYYWSRGKIKIAPRMNSSLFLGFVVFAIGMSAWVLLDPNFGWTSSLSHASRFSLRRGGYSSIP